MPEERARIVIHRMRQSLLSRKIMPYSIEVCKTTSFLLSKQNCLLRLRSYGGQCRPTAFCGLVAVS